MHHTGPIQRSLVGTVSTSKTSDANLAANPVLSLACLTSQQPKPRRRLSGRLHADVQRSNLIGKMPASTRHTRRCQQSIPRTICINVIYWTKINNAAASLKPRPFKNPIQTLNWKNTTGMNRLSVELIRRLFPPRKPAHFVCLSVSVTCAGAGRARRGDRGRGSGGFRSSHSTSKQQ